MSIRAQKKAIINNVRKVFKGQIPRRIERSLTSIGIVVGNKALERTPLDTSALINSQDRLLYRTSTSYTMAIIYTQAYAAALHEREDWKPRPVGSPGKPDGGFNPNATPKFLTSAGDDSMGIIEKIVRGDMRL